jgi:plastocyanin
VVIVDNDGPLPNQGIDLRTGQWGYSPAHTAVRQGEPIVFDNPAGNFRPHNVVSIAAPGQPFPPARETGVPINSGMTRETLLTPGGSWKLETADVAPGHYGYFCTLHPWMVGSITVLPPQ